MHLDGFLLQNVVSTNMADFTAPHAPLFCSSPAHFDINYDLLLDRCMTK